ncbi:endonuclease domain-containing protein [Streptomyces sp. NPDC058471]|uniref:endonuclease domain-containing protein n=1 Tax=Streptomyces sp. NPDC058471 TaxID=3346516 RepID=UPI0036659992
MIDLLDNAERVQRLLLSNASRCSCKKAVPIGDLYHMRQDGAEGWLTVCNACRGVELGERSIYAAQMLGVAYDSKRMRSALPTQFLCALCGGTAKVWDHCHDHGMTRGPLCDSCNQSETYIFANCWDGKALLGSWGRNSLKEVSMQEVATYLQTCKTCADLRTIPIHHWAYLAHEGLWGAPHGRGNADLGRCGEWNRLNPCEMFRLRNHKAASALVPLFWDQPGAPSPDWICRTHRRPARPYGITREMARAAATERLDALHIEGIRPPW